MVVAGSLFVDPARREHYLVACRAVVAQARTTQGCIDFALSPDLVDERRINVYERWASEEALTNFRASGPFHPQTDAIKDADVQEFHIHG